MCTLIIESPYSHASNDRHRRSVPLRYWDLEFLLCGQREIRLHGVSQRTMDLILSYDRELWRRLYCRLHWKNLSLYDVISAASRLAMQWGDREWAYESTENRGDDIWRSRPCCRQDAARCGEKLIWKTLVDTKQHEMCRLVDGGVDCWVDRADYLGKPFLPWVLCFCYVTQNVKDTFITTLYFAVWSGRVRNDVTFLDMKFFTNFL